MSVEYEERFNRYAKNDRGNPPARMPHPGPSFYADMRRAVAVAPGSRRRPGTAWLGSEASKESPGLLAPERMPLLICNGDGPWGKVSRN